MKQLNLVNKEFEATLEVFNKRKVLEGKSASHIQSTTSLSKEFLHYLENNKVQDLKKVKQKHVNGYFKYLQQRKNERRGGGLSSSYLEKHKEAVLRFIEFTKGVDVGQSGIYIQKFKTDRVPKDILTEEEVMQLFKENSEPTIDGIRNTAILSLLYGCGLRKGELHKLNVSDINMAKDTVRIEQTKTSYQRDVMMVTKIKQNIEAYLYSIRELLIPEDVQEDAFLLNNLGKRMSLQGIQHKVKTMAQKSAIQKPITAHRLRHAIATHLLGELQLEEIALFLGHRNIDSSQIYTHIKYTKTPK